MLASVLIAATMVGQGVAVASKPSTVQPAVVVTEPRVLVIEPPGDFFADNHPVLRFRWPSEYLELLPFPSKTPPAGPTPERRMSPLPISPVSNPPVASRPAPPSNSIQERIDALEWGIALLRANRGSAGSIEMLQKELDAAKRDAKKSK